MTRQPRIQQRLFQAGAARAVDMGEYAPIAVPGTDSENQANPLFREKCRCKPCSFLCARSAVPLLKKAGRGVIVLISSVAATGVSSSVAYGSSKGGVSSLGVTLAAKLAPDNIRVNAILPGLVAGDRQRRVLEAKAQQRGISYAEMERTAFSYTSVSYTHLTLPTSDLV